MISNVHLFEFVKIKFYKTETDLLDKTPAFFLKYIVTRSDVDKNLENMQNPEYVKPLVLVNIL